MTRELKPRNREAMARELRTAYAISGKQTEPERWADAADLVAEWIKEEVIASALARDGMRRDAEIAGDARAEVLKREGVPPIPMLLWCPACGERHIDEGAFATKVHHTHACQACGAVWRPAIVATTGVRFLPGFSNGTVGTTVASATLGMTRGEAIEIARRCARAKPKGYFAEPFEPHEWVVDAIVAASERRAP